MAQNDPIKKIRYIAKESLLLIRLSRTPLEADSDAHLEIVRELGEHEKPAWTSPVGGDV